MAWAEHKARPLHGGTLATFVASIDLTGNTSMNTSMEVGIKVVAEDIMG